MTIAELSQAISDHLTGVLDLQQSIVDLCGGFVVIDNGGNVAMVHQTAREYLLGNNKRPFYIDRDAAHEQMFVSCMRCLMSTGLRGKVNRKLEPEFVAYSATWWSLHLANSPPTSERVLNSLIKFLTGHWVLTWIHILAASGKLQVLVRSSGYLSKYTARWKRHSAAQASHSHYIVHQSLLETWAGDCVKIVGKFASSLRRSPEAIYKMIPPFCPTNSAIYQQFGKHEAKALMVSGPLVENWGDSLARLSPSSGMYASSISAAGAHIAFLATSGIVSLLDSSTFEEAAASPFRHGERVYRMVMDATGTLLATYGFKTTKIWNTITGECRWTIENPVSRPRPLAMLMTDSNTSLLIGADDRRIRLLNLTEAYPTWQDVAELEEPELEGHFLNSSSYMAFNRDGSLVAVAYRGHPLSAWEVDGPVHIGHCWRQRKEVARGEVIDAVWHPYDPQIFGLYIEGVIFKWSPYENEVSELAIGASKLAVSGDGNLLATGDVHGITRIYTASDFGLLYQLASQDSVLGLAFSPDQLRLYDIRGYHGNVWEPTALLKFADSAVNGPGTDSETTSLTQSNTLLMNNTPKIQSITALAGSPGGRFYCYATEDGSVHLGDELLSKTLDLHFSRSFLSIERITWGPGGTQICFSDSSKRIFVRSIRAATPDSETTVDVQTEIAAKNTTEGPILQLLFRPDSKSLLIYTSSTLCTASLESGSVAQSRKWHTDTHKWIVHPQDPTLLLGIGLDSVCVLNWDLIALHTYKIVSSAFNDRSNAAETLPREGAVDRVLVSQNKQRILVQISYSSQLSKKKLFLSFKTSSFLLSSTVEPDSSQAATANAVPIPQDVASNIALAFTFLSQDRLVFLSRDFSICSWRLTTSTASSSRPPPPPKLLSDSATMTLSSVKSSSDRRHSYNVSGTSDNAVKQLFLLPGDWIGKDCLAFACVWDVEKSLMVPRNGHVALVRSAALA